MRNGVNVFLLFAAVAVNMFSFPFEAYAEPPPAKPLQAGEDRWVPSFSIAGGTTFQDVEAASVSAVSSVSAILQGLPAVALQPRCDPDDPGCPPIPLAGQDLVVAPLVSGTLELMTPALPIPTRPRFFLGGELGGLFASERRLALQGDPSCVSGPEPFAPCAVDEVPVDPPTQGSRTQAFGEEGAVGQGTRTTVETDTLTYGANAGVAFPLQFGKRQFRIKPSFAWMSYKVDAAGFLVNAACAPVIPPQPQTLPPTQCTPTVRRPTQAFLREPESLSASASERFHAIGAGLDFEMDTGRFGPIGSSLFLGGRAYYTLGDRDITFVTSQIYEDQLGGGADDPDVAIAGFNVEVDPWLYRVHVGIRFQWLGGRN